ncbi:MAG: 4Fe-4S binding protein [Candidatus Izemoplasma sp.]|nr:4Fe-4S binding protein [Candidatus Izemoplasma sp.]
MNYTVKVDEDKCIGCSICSRICPTGTLKIDRKFKKAYTTDIECDNAWGCLYACPTNALSMTEATG